MSNGPGYETPRPKITADMNADIQAAAAGAIAQIASTFSTPTQRLVDAFHANPAINLDYSKLIGEKPSPEQLDPRSEVRIGITPLPVPPERINITEDRYTEEISGLRTRGNSLVKTGRGQIRISMPLEFPNFEAVNGSLREIIAQFRSCPFLTVENDLVSTAILQRQSDVTPLDEYVKSKAELEQITLKYMQAKTKAIEEIVRGSSAILPVAMRVGSVEEARTAMNRMTAAQLEGVVKSVVSTLKISRWFKAGDFLPKESVLRPLLKVMEDSWGILIEKQTAVAEAAIKSTFAYPAVPVALHQLVCRTVPGFPERLQANLEALYFNTSPYMSSTLFVGPTGAWTLNLGNCPTYKDWFGSRFLDNDEIKAYDHTAWAGALGRMSPTSHGLLVLEYPVPESERKDKDPRRPEASTAGSTRVGTENPDSIEYKPKTKKFFIDSKNKNIIVDQVIVSLENRLAPQPVEGSMYGTLQYLGAMNAKIRVILTVTGVDTNEHNRFLSKVHAIKKATEEVALQGGQRARRNARIKIENDVVRLFGVQNVLLSRITTNSKAVNTSEVILDFIEYTTSQEKRERIIRIKPDSRKEVWRRTLKFVINLAGARVHGWGSKDAMEAMTSDDLDNPGEWALDWLYDPEEGVITKRLMAAVLSKLGLHVDKSENRLNFDYHKNPNRDEMYQSFEDALFTKYGREEQPGFEEVTLFQIDEMMKQNPDFKRVGEYMGLDASIDRAREFAAREGRNPVYGFYLDRRDLWKMFKNAKIHGAFDITPSEVDDTVNQVAQDHIDHWSTRSLDPLWEKKEALRSFSTVAASAPLSAPSMFAAADFAKKFGRDSYGFTEIPPIPTDLFIETMVDILLPRPVGQPEKYKPNPEAANAGPAPHRFLHERKMMEALVHHAETRFTTLADELAGMREEQRGTAPYGDLDLPTYGKAYYRLWSAIKEAGYDILREDFDGAPENVKEVVRRVVPTYEDLGERPPFGKARWDFARGVEDTVDPDFFFFWFKMKKALRSAAEVAMKTAEETTPRYADVSRKNVMRIEKNSLAKMQQNAAAPEGTHRHTNVYDEDPAPAQPVSVKKVRAVQLPSGLVKTVRNVLEPSATSLYVPLREDLREELKDYNPDDDKHRKRLFQEAVDDTKDEFRRMVTAFPAFKVYLIETDSEQWSLFDDFYGYNSIRSIRVFHHKYTPDLAEIEIINTTGNLDELRADLSDKEQEEREERIRTAKDREEGTNEPQQLDHFFMETGTPILIRMGYSADPRKLPTRFVGQIVSIRAGDITKIVAQGYSAELTVPISAKTGRLPHNVVKTVMTESPTVHYGLWSLTKQDPDAINEMTGENTDDSGAGRDPWIMDVKRSWTGKLGADISKRLPTTMIRRVYGDFFATRRLSNVFLPAQQYSSGLYNPGAESWGIPNITGLEALHELVRHHPGYVFDTRPYDHQATLFFGKPEQPYFFTNKKVDEEKRWQRRKKLLEQYIDVKIEDLYREFFSTHHSTPFSAYVSARRGPSFGGYVKLAFQGFWGELAGTAGGVYQKATWLPRVFGRLVGWDGVAGLGADAENRWTAATDTSDVLRQTETPDVTAELETLFDKLGPDGVRVIAGLFFTQYGDHRSVGDMYVPGGLWIRDVGRALRTMRRASTAAATFSPLDLYSSAKDSYSWLGRGSKVLGLTDSEPPPGYVFAAMSDFERAVRRISENIKGSAGTTISSEHDMKKVLGEAFGPIDESRPAMGINGEAIKVSLYRRSARSITRWIPEWKNFLITFNRFLQDTTNVELKKAIYEAVQKRQVLGLNPRMKRFRSHHMVSSAIDIVKNDITATKEFMANRVIIRYPDTVRHLDTADKVFTQAFQKFGENLVVVRKSGDNWTSLELAYNDDIDPDQWKVRMVTEPNAASKEQAFLCAKSNLAEALRPMYRGNLIVRGHAAMLPYDIVWINDEYNHVYGPVEAETIIDQMDQTGYTLSIVPNAVTWADSNSEHADDTTSGIWTSLFMSGVLATIAAPTNIAGPSAVDAVIQHHDSRMRKIYGKSIADDVLDRFRGFIIGSSSAVGEDTGVRILPLVRHGRPWTAGMKGIGGGGWKQRWLRRWKNVKRGWSEFRERITDYLF